MNRLLLSALLVQRSAVRYTPAGLPVLELSLQHDSELTEDGTQRKVSIELKAVAIGAITAGLLTAPLGSAALFAGFVTAARNGRGLQFHITSVESLA